MISKSKTYRSKVFWTSPKGRSGNLMASLLPEQFTMYLYVIISSKGQDAIETSRAL